MNVKVTKNKVVVEKKYTVNKGEYHANLLEFTFSEEYTDSLVKKVIFLTGDTKIEQAIINNQCHIPYEVLNSDSFQLRVYAYEVQDNELILRYSPTYDTIYLREGSYTGDTGSGEEITPTQYEQYEAALNQGLQDLEEGITQVENVDIDVNKIGAVTTVTITDKNGIQKSEQINDGSDYILTNQDKQDIANIVEQDISVDVPTKTSQLTNDSGFIDKTVDNLNNYYKKTETYTKTEVDNKVVAVYKYKGSVARYINLPSTGLTVGDVYNVEYDGSNYAWTGTTWDKLGSDIDLSAYYTSSQTDTLLSGKVDKETGKGLSANDYTTLEKNKLAGLSNYDDTQIRSYIGTLTNLNTTTKTDLVSAINELVTDIGDIDTALDTINGEVI